ncbi:MBL fold metallo-hydrolase [Cesiribacter andamanensis]|uniref:Hydroxyacylglutathione hydrolase n=1 Tax=Cesiribacter andamanensis AMV16 TaxID=1279009 RepID=M7NG96_9BACT|nr:MBL fold metallo-hydrolase [Cesiribacter andamanensis]EMR00835.1 hydroxyacylglutathione hydrolase [Cesiribacter andamanensis AMV16]
MSRLKKMVMNDEPQLVAPGIYRLSSTIVNVYFIGLPAGPWVLVDTGMPFSAGQIRQAAESLYGLDARPEAILMTHGHFDHAGSVEELSRSWDVAVYAHPREFPYLSGRCEYPPQDPTVGGFGGQMSRVYTNKPYNVAERLQALPEDGSLPMLQDWKWVFTPGHTPGHVSFFRERDRVLIAGDAIITMDIHNPAGLMGGHTGLWGPPEYFTPDWRMALKSIDKLALLKPKTLLTGHGDPLSYRGLDLDLVQFADKYRPPLHGRYIPYAAEFAEDGSVLSVPPPVNDTLVTVLAGVGAGLVGLAAVYGAFKLNSNRKSRIEERYRLHRTTIDLPWNKRINRPAARSDRQYKPVTYSLMRKKRYDVEDR